MIILVPAVRDTSHGIGLDEDVLHVLSKCCGAIITNGDESECQTCSYSYNDELAPHPYNMDARCSTVLRINSDEKRNQGLVKGWIEAWIGRPVENFTVEW